MLHNSDNLGASIIRPSSPEVKRYMQSVLMKETAAYHLLKNDCEQECVYTLIRNGTERVRTGVMSRQKARRMNERNQTLGIPLRWMLGGKKEAKK